LCGTSGDGRHLGSGKRTPFTRPPRNRSWRPSSQSMALATASPCPRARRRRQGCQRRSLRSRTREDNAHAQRTLGRRSEGRVVNRDSPRPRSHRVARATRCLPRASSDGRSGSAKEDVSRERARAARLGRSVIPARGKPRTDHGSQRWETAKQGCSSWKGSECRSRSNASRPLRPWALPSAQGDERPSSNESHEAQ